MRAYDLLQFAVDTAEAADCSSLPDPVPAGDVGRQERVDRARQLLRDHTADSDDPKLRAFAEYIIGRVQQAVILKCGFDNLQLRLRIQPLETDECATNRQLNH